MSASSSRPLLGVILVVFATLAFAGSDVVTKHLTASYPVPVIAAIRYAINFLLLAVFLMPRMGSTLWQTNKFILVIGRGLVLAFATLTMGIALRYMPVGETIAILYLSPFAVMLLAGPLLGEHAQRSALLWAAVAFVGVLLIVRPGGGLHPFGVVMAVVNAMLATVYHLSTRYLTRTETTLSMLFHTAWVGAVFFALSSLGSLEGLSIAPVDLLWMLLLGVLATLGHYLFTLSYREAPAALIAPLNYLHLVWAGGLGFVVFGHLPDGISLIGMGLVVFGGVALALGAQTRARREKA